VRELAPLLPLLSSLGRPSLLIAGAQRCCLASAQLARQKQVLERASSSSSSSGADAGAREGAGAGAGGQGQGGSLLVSRWDEGRERQLKEAVKQANLAALGFAVVAPPNPLSSASSASSSSSSSSSSASFDSPAPPPAAAGISPDGARGGGGEGREEGQISS
jgi:hypothetical protein